MTRASLYGAAWVLLFAAIAVFGPDTPNPYAHAANAAAVRGTQVQLVQGKGVEWWSRRAVQARKDANARARTIRVLRAALRARVDYVPRRGLASARAGGLVAAFLCIHGFEGSWNDTRNPIYHGGLQMDDRFEQRYGGEFVRAWGHSYNWPAFVQVAVSIRAYLSGRGFAPWPNTSRMCGLR